MTTEESTQARTLLNAVERMLDQPDEIERVVQRLRDEAGNDVHRVADRLVSHYSNRSAFAGGISGIPGLVPGVGTLVAIAGTTLAEMAYVLKLEVEMCFALALAHGFDIRDTKERQLALLLAAVEPHEVETGRNVLADAGDVAITAAMNYTPRELEKLVLRAFGIAALVYACKTVPKAAAHAIPLVGVGIGAGVNKLRTRRVGKRAAAWYGARREVRERSGSRGTPHRAD